MRVIKYFLKHWEQLDFIHPATSFIKSSSIFLYQALAKAAPRTMCSEATAGSEGEIFMAKSILVEGIVLTPRKSHEFTIDTTQFLEIIESSYCSHTSEKLFRDMIPLSLYTYYCEVLLWKRLYLVLHGTDAISNAEFENFQAALSNLNVPLEIAQYLDGIGHVRDPSCVNYTLTLLETLSPATLHGITGHYGRITCNNHIAYETMPAPIIILERLVHDIALLIDNVVDPNWDTILSPSTTAKPAKPNRNLLGWSVARAVTAAQYEWLSTHLSVTIDAAHAVTWQFKDLENICRLPIARGMLDMVSSVLPPIKYKESTARGGSISQMLFHDRSVADHLGTTPNTKIPRISTYEMKGNSYRTANIFTLSAATIFRYRVKRVAEASAPDSLCYLATKSNAALEGWMETADSSFASLETSAWNTSEFLTPYSCGNKKADDYVKRCTEH